ncbi:MAG: hypothetical protein FJZ01_01770 [Candidatus Sericytochromatia bacterium]|nr:hypothetical protein [Candidatus Tanganyikabacteria bacterium]
MNSFEDALRAELAAAPPAPDGPEPDPAPLMAALREVAVALPMVDNLGRTGDATDLYPWLDRLAAGARTLYPEIPCGAGCSACCHYPVSLYTIAEAEWRPMADLVARKWPRERLEAFVRRFWGSHGPYLWRLRVLNFLMEIPLPVVARREAIPLACPFLEDDRCAVYAARPAIARAFGLFSFKHFFLRKPVPYGCDLTRERLDPVLAIKDRPGLPSFNPFFGVRGALARGPRRFIPLWVAREWPRSWLREATSGRDGMSS